MKTVRGKWAGGDRIRLIYKSRGLERPQFAERLGISYDRLLAYESGRTEPSPEFFRQLLEVFPDIDLNWVITGKGFPQKSSGLPILTSVRAGLLSEHVEDGVLGHLPVYQTSDQLFGLKVIGNSMSPELEEGDIVICDPNKSFVNGGIHVVCSERSTYTVKRVFKRRDGFELVPSNPEYATTQIESKDVEAIIKVIGAERMIEK